MKAQNFYFYAGLCLTAFFTLLYFLYPILKWQAFFDAAVVFLPMIVGILIAALLLFAGIYLMIKGLNQGKEKKHVRYL